MNYQDSSSDDVPYLPPEQYENYAEQQRIQRLSADQPRPEQRRGRSYFTEEELRELDTPSDETGSYGSRSSGGVHEGPTESRIPRPPLNFTSDTDLRQSNQSNGHDYAVLSAPHPVPVHGRHANSESGDYSPESEGQPQTPKISWGRKIIGVLLIAIPGVLFSVAAHFVDWSMSDFQLFSASFFIFQGVFWPSLGMLLADYFCKPKKRKESVQKVRPSQSQDRNQSKCQSRKWILALVVFVHANVFACAMILQLLSIQHLNISISLALSFGFDVIVLLIQYIMETRRCSLELMLLSVVSYLGYGIAAIPAFTSSSRDTRYDTAIGVGASVGVMLLSVVASFLLSHLRKHHVSDSVIGTSFAFFGCIQSLITKEIMGSTLNAQLGGKAVGWAAGLISVIFLGTIFLYLEARLSSLIWKRDEDEEENKSNEFSTLTRTRLSVFILSCLWELSQQGFRDTKPDPYDIFGGFLVIFAFLLANGFRAWHYRADDGVHLDQVDSNENRNASKFFAFIPWLFAQKFGKQGSK